MRFQFGSGALVTAVITLMIMVPVRSAEYPLRVIVTGDTDIDHVTSLRDGEIRVLSGGEMSSFLSDGTMVYQRTRDSAERIYPCETGSFYGIAQHGHGAADFAPAASFALYDSTDTVRWSTGPTTDASFIVSARGAVVGLSLNINTPERNTLHFYESDGSLMHEVMLPFVAGGRFTPRGTMFLAISAVEGIVAFDPHGNRMWHVPGVRLFASTADGVLVALVAGDELMVCTHGSVTARVSLEGLLVRRLAFSSDGSRIAVAGRDELRVYDPGLTFLWNNSIAGTDHVFTSVEAASDYGWLIAGVARDRGSAVPVQERHPDGGILIFDAGGTVRHTIPLVFKSWNIFTPTVTLTGNEASAVVSTRRSVYLLELP